MKNIILNQRAECNELMACPYHQRDVRYTFDELLANPLIKLITGPRRVGKSMFALLMLQGKNFAYLNFDDNLLLENWDEDLVMQMLDDVYPGYEYLLLDEIQNLPDWDLWVNKLYRRGKNLIITGSNAKMLSSEMATVLTGRYLQIEMLPFSLEETMRWKNVNPNLPHFNNKMKLMKKAPSKIYVIDNGFVQSTALNLSENLGRLLENQVFVDLLRRGYIPGKTRFYTRNDKEISFVTRKGSKAEYLIQVCYDMSAEKTRKRELDALVKASEEPNCDNLLVITNSQEEQIETKNKTVKIIINNKF